MTKIKILKCNNCKTIQTGSYICKYCYRLIDDNDIFDYYEYDEYIEDDDSQEKYFCYNHSAVSEGIITYSDDYYKDF